VAPSKVMPAEMQIPHNVPRGRFKHVLFDFDGTISLLREGWERIMGPLMVEVITGASEAAPEIEQEVAAYIDESTGVQTILQMERLTEMVRAHGLIPEDQIRDAQAYKWLYNARLMEIVHGRIAKLESGTLTIDDVTVSGAVAFLEELRNRDLTLYVFSGTDAADVRYEAATLGVTPYFKEIWGALDTYEAYSKEKVLREILREHGLHGSEVLVVGDGPVEIRNAKQHGCVALGVASDEARGWGWNEEKRVRLLKAGADILIPDFREHEMLTAYLVPA